jgi:hypothetical protein
MSDEHPLVQPRFSSEDYVLVSDIETYEDRPIGETFFQGANIGYSQVKVTSIVPSDVKRTAAGYTINEFLYRIRLSNNCNSNGYDSTPC